MSDLPNDIARLVSELHTKIAARYRDLARQTPEGERAYAVAVAICQARGLNAESIVTSTRVPTMAGSFAMAPVYDLQPLWTKYFEEAKAAIDVIDKRTPPVSGEDAAAI